MTCTKTLNVVIATNCDGKCGSPLESCEIFGLTDYIRFSACNARCCRPPASLLHVATGQEDGGLVENEDTREGGAGIAPDCVQPVDRPDDGEHGPLDPAECSDNCAGIEGDTECFQHRRGAAGHDRRGGPLPSSLACAR